MRLRLKCMLLLQKVESKIEKKNNTEIRNYSNEESL